MTLPTPRGLATIVAATAVLAACSRGVSVGSPSPASTSVAPALPSGVTPAMVAEGQTLFEAQTSNCSRCHGINGKGTERGPDLTDGAWAQTDGSYPAIVRLITTGVPAANIKGNYRFNMRPKGGSALTEAQVSSVAAYIYSISHH